MFYIQQNEAVCTETYLLFNALKVLLNGIFLSVGIIALRKDIYFPALFFIAIP